MSQLSYRFAFNWKGTWSSATSYQRDDLAKHDGAVYKATTPSRGQTPQASSGYWELFVDKGGSFTLGSLTTANVRDHGATGLGIADDTTAITAAVAALGPGGGVLLFPAGTYLAGNFTYPSTVVLWGLPGAKLRIAGQDINIPRGNETTGPLEYFVSTTGSATNHGLSSAAPVNKVSTVLARMPKSLWHDVVIYVANGTYTEDAMIDEYGRKSGLYLDGFALNATRTPVDATYPTSRSWALNNKGGILSIVGSGSGNVIIQGRADGVAYVDGTHGRNGLVAHRRNVYIKGLTFKNYDLVLNAHEGGKIAGSDVKIRNWGTAGILVEGQGSAIEMSTLDLSSAGLAGGYNIWALQGLVSLTAAALVNGVGAPLVLAENSWVDVGGGSTMASADGTLREGVRCIASSVSIGNTVMDNIQTVNQGGALFINNGATVKNAAVGVLCRGGYTGIDGATHLFDNTIAIQIDDGYLSLGSANSMDGATQKYNSTCGIKMNGGETGYSPYAVGTAGWLVKGPTGTTEKHILYGQGTAAKYPSANQAQVSAAFGGTDLKDAVNALLAKATSPSPSDRPTAIYGAWNAIASLSTNTVADIAAKLSAMAVALETAGLIADSAVYEVSGTSESALWHDRVRNRFNQLVQDLQAFGLMTPGASVDPGNLVASVTSSTYTASLLDSTVVVNYAGAATITLPASPFPGQRVTVKDTSGAGATNPITVDGNGTDTIDGAATHVIPTNYGWATFEATSATTWAVVGTDKRQLVVTTVQDFGSVAAGGAAGVTVAVPGAAVGDVVTVGAPPILNGLIPWGYVTEAGSVALVLSNHTVGAQDPGSGTFTIRVLKA